MYINSLKIENFKNIESKSFRFNKINLLEGDNGHGKSSVLESIIFLLTNQLLNGKLEDYVCWGEKGFKLISNLIDYSDNLINYEVEYNKTTKRKLVLNNNVEDIFLNSDAVKYMNTIINPDISLYSNISLQGESIALLSEKPTPRLEKFKLFFSINKVDIAIDNVKNDIDSIKNDIKQIESELIILKETKFDYIEEYELEDYSSLKSEVDLLESKKQKYDIELKLYEKYLNELIKYKEDENLKTKYNNDLSAYQNELNYLNDNNKYKKDIDSLKENCNKIKNLYSQVKSEKETKEKLVLKLNIISEKINKLNTEYNSISISRIAPLEKTSEEIQVVINEKDNLYKEYLNLQNKHKAIKDGKCFNCGAVYNSESIDDVVLNLNQARESYEKINNEVIEYTNNLNTYEKRIKENEISNIKKESLQSNIESLENEKKSYEEQISKLVINNYNESELKKELDEINIEIIKTNEYISSVESIKNKINTCEIKLENYKDLNKPEDVEEPENFNNNFYEDRKKELYVFIEREKHLNEIKEINNKTKIKEKESIKNITEKENIIDNSRSKLVLLESTRKVLAKDFSSFLIDKGTEFIKRKMNEIFSKSFGRYNITLSRDSKGVDFYYSSPEKNVIAPVGMASGYEKQVLSVSFRLALSNLHKLGIFIFDEIDSDSSEQNSLRLYKNILMQNFKQLFIVTHKEKTKEYLQTLRECSVFDF